MQTMLYPGVRSGVYRSNPMDIAVALTVKWLMLIVILSQRLYRSMRVLLFYHIYYVFYNIKPTINQIIQPLHNN